MSETFSRFAPVPSHGRRARHHSRNRRAALFAAALLCAGWCLPAAAIDRVVVKGLFKDHAILDIDGHQRMLAAGQRSPEGVLLVSATSQEAVLEIDGKQDTYTLGTQIGSTFKAPEPGRTVTIAPDSTGSYRVAGSINGYQVSFVVDTGATLVAMNRNEAKRMGIQYKLDGDAAVSETASGRDRIYVVDLKKVTVGDIEVSDVKAAVHDSDFPSVVLLGNSFLSRVKIQQDGRLLQLIGK